MQIPIAMISIWTQTVDMFERLREIIFRRIWKERVIL